MHFMVEDIQVKRFILF